MCRQVGPRSLVPYGPYLKTCGPVRGTDRWLPGLGQLVSWIVASAGRPSTLGGPWGVGRRNRFHEVCSFPAP